MYITKTFTLDNIFKISLQSQNLQAKVVAVLQALKRMDAFIQRKSTQEETYSENSNSNKFPNVSGFSTMSTSSPEENPIVNNVDFLSSRSQEEIGAFEPLEYEESDDNEVDDDDLFIDCDSIEKEEEEFTAIVDGSPVDELTRKILERLGRSVNRGEPPSEYTVGKTFWVSSPCPSFALQSNQAPNPNDLCVPRMFLWFPQYLTGNGKKLLCSVPECNGHLNVKGFTPKARRVIDINDSFYMLTSRFVCSKSAKHNFTGYDNSIIRQLPLRVQNDFPALLTLRSGLSSSLVNFIRPLMQNSVGPGRIHKILREIHRLRYDNLQFQYLNAALEYKNSSSGLVTYKAAEFSEFEDLKGYSGRVPSAVYIGYVYTSCIENLKARIDAEMMKLGGVVLKGDHTFKIIKKIAKLKGVSIFTALYTLCNEFEEIRMMVLAPTKSLLHLEERFLEMMKTYLKNEEEKPRVFYTDNVVADQPSLERWIPSLKENVKHTNEETKGNPNLSTYILPDDTTILYLQNAVQMNVMASRLIHCLTPDSSGNTIPIHVGFDCEWTTKYINKTSFRQKISLVQIAFNNFVYLFHLDNTQPMPGQLKLLIEDTNVIKIGRSVKQDLMKLESDYGIAKTAYHPKAILDLGSKYMEIGHIDSLKQCSLQFLCEDVLNKFLPKPESIRCGDWEANRLDLAQRKYAAIDAYISLDLYEKMKTLEVYNLRVNQKSSVGTIVNVYATSKTCRGKQLAVGKILESSDVISSNCRNCVNVQLSKVLKNDSFAPVCHHDKRTSKRLKKTFTNMNVEENITTIHLSYNCLKTTKLRVEDYQVFESSTVPTLVLKDPFHLMDSIPVSEKHGAQKVFMSRFSDALFVPSIEDKKRVDDALTLQKTTYEAVSKENPAWIAKRVRRVIPPSKDLLPVVKKLFTEFEDAECAKSGLPLFDKACKAQAKKVIDAISKGHVSDPVGVRLYHIRYVDGLGLPVYRCIRGTNSLEGGVHTNIIRKFSMYNASPRLTDCLLADYRLRHNTDVGSLNRYNVIHKSHYNPWLVQGINHLKSELGMTVKGSYYDPDGNGIHFFPVGESFGICPVPDFTKQHLEMASHKSDNQYPLPSACTIEDVLQLCALPMASVRRRKMSTYQYLAQIQNTKYPVVPIHTKREQDKFWQLYTELESSHNKANPDFIRMAKEWCYRTNKQNELFPRNKIPADFYKIPELLESFFNKSQNNNTYFNTTKISKNTARLTAAKSAVNPSNRPNVVINSPVPLSGLKHTSPRPLASNIPVKRPSHSPRIFMPQLLPLPPINIITKKRKISKKRCFTCAQREPANMYICPGKQKLQECKYFNFSSS